MTKTKRMGICAAALCLMLLTAGPVPAQAATAMEMLRTEVTQVIDVLRNKSLKEDVKREKLRAIYNRMFNQEELSRWSLGRHWNALTEAQRKEFSPLFQQVLENTYADRILAYDNERILFDRELPIARSRVEVQTRVVAKSREIPVNYRLLQEKDGRWRVYDVVVENVSLVMNYRSQFNEILAKNTPADLIEILRKRAKEQKS